MAKLTSSQLTELGDQFLAIAQAVGNYRMENRPLLTRVQNQQVKELHLDLLNYADDFFTGSVKLVMNDIQDSLDRINGITVNINKTYKKLDDFQKAIDIAAAAVTVAASIFSKNPVAIDKAISDLNETIRKKN